MFGNCFFVLLLLISPCFQLLGQEQKEDKTIVLQGTVLDTQTKETLSYAAIQLSSENKVIYGAITDTNGQFKLHNLPIGNYTLVISYLGYDRWEQSLSLYKNTLLHFPLSSSATALNEVVVTASESKGMTTASTIDRTAMKHLQPTSFTDLLELLPGGKAKDPIMGSPNLIHMRNASSTSEVIASLGVSFRIDGNMINTDGNLQAVPGVNNEKEFVSKGLDMRTLSTDNIESVTIIRGIPSVEYGGLTDGLVDIKLKNKQTPWEGRFKADQVGKLFAIGKGIGLSEKAVLNVDLSYLDSKIDPRNALENYKRITASARFHKTNKMRKEYLLNWGMNVSYTGSLDDRKEDPEIMMREDKYSSSYDNILAGGNLELLFPQKHIMHSLKLHGSMNQSFDRIEQTKAIYLDRPTAIPNTTETGESDGTYLPYQYIARMKVDGKPLHTHLKLSGKLGFETWTIGHVVIAGTELTYTKNRGEGMVYDVNRPLSYTSNYRPRAYKAIPGKKELGFYLEDALLLPLGQHLVKGNVGIRGESLLGLDSRFAMQGKVYIDPRLRLLWELPAIKDWHFDLSTGIGWHTKTPTVSQLYPDPFYEDIVQLNYYHTNPEYRRIHLMTYTWDLTNYALEPARNRKWEVRLGVDYKGNKFSLTYFDEQMDNAFREKSYYTLLPYKEYDTSTIDHTSITAPPSLEELNYTEEVLVNARKNQWGNGSFIHKQGIEFQYASKRIDLLKTRVTVDGAWFKTTTRNSMPFYRQSSVLINNKQLQYIGLYTWEDGAEKQAFQTKCKVDTYLPFLGLTFSADAQCTWFTSTKPLWNNGTPEYYLGKDGIPHVFTEADKEDMYLQHLVQKYSADYFTQEKIPFLMDIHFKANKEIGKYIELALYVNRLLTLYPDYERRGQTVHREARSPYFGMEMNIRF